AEPGDRQRHRRHAVSLQRFPMRYARFARRILFFSFDFSALVDGCVRVPPARCRLHSSVTPASSA
ncbi:hypothetical protein, partial [Burkholderia multivorans]|uniref:hypothetical protein n=1 Tax=Burkholderia multivorans TaxID=87883 RepID=UPI001C654B63